MLSIQSLLIAITSTLAERHRVVDRIASAPSEIAAAEHLSECIIDIDRALGELADEYEALRTITPSFPKFDALYSEG